MISCKAKKQQKTQYQKLSYLMAWREIEVCQPFLSEYKIRSSKLLLKADVRNGNIKEKSIRIFKFLTQRIIIELNTRLQLDTIIYSLQKLNARIQ